MIYIFFDYWFVKVINLCWSYLSRDSRKRRRSSDTESQFDSDDNRIIHESFSVAPAPNGNLGDCLELIVVFLDNHIFESINAPTAVVKDAWKVFSEIVKKICQQGHCLQFCFDGTAIFQFNCFIFLQKPVLTVLLSKK